MDELLTRWTIRLALACYIAVLAGWLVRWRSRVWQPVARWLWTAGCLLFLAHVLCAFHFYHHWSHRAAVEDTARQTQELMGWQFGEGIYFSYLFTLIWVADVAWWWIGPTSYRQRPIAIAAIIHGYVFFIAFNGAVLFEVGAIRWVGVAACAGLGLLLAWRLREKSRSSPPADSSFHE